MIRIAITDDKVSNRKMVTDKLSAAGGFDILFQAVDGDDFLKQMQEYKDKQLPDIVLMDLEMPGVDGVSAIATASSLYPDVHYVVLTVFDDEDKIFRAIRAGACGYVLKEESGTVLSQMLFSLYENGAGPVSPGIAYKILQMVQQEKKPDQDKRDNFFSLSDREQEILQWLSQGLDYKEIGEKLFISHNTVKKHTISIYQKLHVNSKAQALRIAYTKGLL